MSNTKARPPRSTAYCRHWNIGLALGQGPEPTAIAILEQETHQPQGSGQGFWTARNVALRLRYLERFPLSASLPDIIKRVRTMLDELRNGDEPEEAEAGSDVIVDATGIGGAIVPLFKEAGLSPIAVTITAGGGEQRVPDDPNAWRVAKTELIGGLRAMLQDRDRLLIAEDLAHRALLEKELTEYKLRPPTINTNDSEAFREMPNDDLVIAVALAVWRAGKNLPEPKAARDAFTKMMAEHYAKRRDLA